MNSYDHLLSRRLFLNGAVMGGMAFGGFGRLFAADNAAQAVKRQKNVILLWMSGGPSQFETWDPKPGQPTGGPHMTIPTSISGIHFDEYMPNLARLAKRMVTVRSMTSKNADHGMGAYIGQTSYESSRIVSPAPHWLSICAHELPSANLLAPSYVNIGTESAEFAVPGSGHLGARYQGLYCPGNGRMPDNLPMDNGLSEAASAKAREELRQRMAARFRQGHDARLVDTHETAFQQMNGLIASRDLFDTSKESAKDQARYGNSPFGRDVLMARRLVSNGVPFVRVQHQGGLAWDKHRRAFESQRHITAEFDTAAGALVDDLIDTGLWQHTLVVCMGEFGRTPDLLGQGTPGRNHWTKCWSLAFGGCGLKEGLVIGATNKDGTDLKDRPVSIHDLFCTLYQALGIDPHKEIDFEGRPVPFVENKLGKSISEVF